MFATSIRRTAMVGLAALMALQLAAPDASARSRHDGHRDDRYRSQQCVDRGDVAAGTVIGAIAGGVIGNQFGRGRDRTASTIAGVILGGIIGNRVADDRYCNRHYQQRAYYDSFEHADPYHRARWDNPYSGDYGYVEPANYYRDDRGRTCREFTQTIFVEGRRETATGVACRHRDGTWQIVDDGDDGYYRR